MSSDGVAQSRRSLWSSFASLFASSGTLLCCALPALLVATGAGATLSSLVSAFPQVVWLSEHKAPLFAFAAVLMALAGWLQWRSRAAPCPVDPQLRDTCLRTRRASRAIYGASVAFFMLGGGFAFVLPWLARS